MIKRVFNGLYAEEFNGYLDSLRKDYILKSPHKDWMETYLCGPEDLTEEEEKKWPKCKCIPFRIPGYTIGHLIVGKDNEGLFKDGLIIKEIVVYERDYDLHSFEPGYSALELDLKKKFEGRELK